MAALRRAALGAVLLWALLTGATLWLVLARDAPADELMILLTLPTTAVGALVARREPRNAVGWVLLVVAVGLAGNGAAESYAGEPGAPGRVAAAWAAEALWYVWFVPAALVLPVVFPDGRVPGRRWRALPWLAAATLLLSTAAATLTPGALDVDGPPLANPMGVAGPLPGVLEALGLVGTAGGVLAAIAALVARVRRSRGRERQQLKWFVLVGVVAMGCLLVSIAALIGGELAGEEDWLYAPAAAGWAGALGALVVGLPAATALAILRHDLYDVDRVIRRTLVYAVLTASLAATYLACVLLLQLALSPVTGDAGLAVAASTLAVAAVFRPARGRVQAAVDRRFFRARYDATRTVRAFGARLRDQVDLDALGGELRGVVGETLQPAHVALWLREVER